MDEYLTPRQRAGRANQKKRKGLTPEGRSALRKAALNNRPWEKSTGPKTEEGKKRSRTNAVKDHDNSVIHLPDVAKEFVEALRLSEKGKGPVPDYKDVIAFMNTLEIKNSEDMGIWLSLSFQVSRCLTMRGEKYASSNGHIIRSGWLGGNTLPFRI